MCWLVFVFESFLSTFRSVDVNISKYHLIEEQSSVSLEGEYLIVLSERTQLPRG